MTPQYLETPLANNVATLATLIGRYLWIRVLYVILMAGTNIVRQNTLNALTDYYDSSMS